MTSARDFNIFKSLAFTGKREHDTELPKESGSLSQKSSLKTVASNDAPKPFFRANAEYQTGIASGRIVESLDGTVEKDERGDDIGSKEVPSVGTNAPPVTPNVLEVRMSHKHLGKTISEKHTPALVAPAIQRQQAEGPNVTQSDSSDDDNTNAIKPPYESARKRADKTAFSEW